MTGIVILVVLGSASSPRITVAAGIILLALSG